MRTLVILLLATRVAAAHPVPEIAADDDPTSWRGPESSALLEWSTWFRLGFGVTSQHPGVVARGTIIPSDQHSAWQTGLGADVSLPIGDTGVRIGPWLELRGLDAFVGGELALTGAPKSFDLFQYDGEGILIARVGGGKEAVTASLSWGYRCPWKLWGPYNKASRYEIGARFVVNVTRAYRDPADWSTTFGLEVEPVGAIRYLLGIRSWY